MKILRKPKIKWECLVAKLFAFGLKSPSVWNSEKSLKFSIRKSQLLIVFWAFSQMFKGSGSCGGIFQPLPFPLCYFLPPCQGICPAVLRPCPLRLCQATFSLLPCGVQPPCQSIWFMKMCLKNTSNFKVIRNKIICWIIPILNDYHDELYTIFGASSVPPSQHRSVEPH